MNVEPEKIKQIISRYGQSKGYPEKSYTAKFCEDFDLNYNQWNAYTRGAQDIGIKVINFLMEKFPDTDMNWLLKKEITVFDSVSEPREFYEEITNEAIMVKLNQIHHDLKKIKF